MEKSIDKSKQYHLNPRKIEDKELIRLQDHLYKFGDLFFTVPLVAINQKQTQASSGGMTDLYIDSGTYVKSFYTVMFMPSSVKIKEMGSINRRLHHNINWNNTVPKIVEQNS